MAVRSRDGQRARLPGPCARHLAAGAGRPRRVPQRNVTLRVLLVPEISAVHLSGRPSS
ncbi:hypothetical protein PSCLAVI8L_130051 [Pseudoclavibacter sp. 8L]|nr:hypothetical protein PSCLAVI8L_130051 [Pseudoclavibacter sp. 8L]